MNKRIISGILSIILIFLCVGCGKNEMSSSVPTPTANKEVKAAAPINLLYNKADSFDPYTSVTETNRNLCRLIYEPLIKTDNSFKPVLSLASDVKLNGTKCTVSLKNAVFSDGSAVTANDVLYSYKKAKSYGGTYTAHLYEVVSVSVDSEKTLTFNLSRNDPFFKNLLDFPIMKAESDKVVDADGVLLTPVGCGRYLLSADKTKLVINDRFFGKKGAIKEINLINAPDNDSLSHYIEVGATELYYTELSDGKIIRMSGKKAEVNLNNFIFLGINAKSSGLSNKFLRYAISSAIDRKAICSDVYFNNAVPATGYFNPCLEGVKSVQSIKSTADTQITVENLSKIGYNNKDSNGYYINSNGKHIVLRLIVNKENRFHVIAANSIASQLKLSGIEIKVVETTFADYSNIIKRNAFELYLGEVSVLPNFDMSALVTKGGSVAFGLNDVEDTPKDDAQKNDDTSSAENSEASAEMKQQTAIIKVLNGYYGGKNSIADVAGTLLTEMPQIPILYRKGMLFYKDNIVSGVESSECDIYYSIENYITE